MSSPRFTPLEEPRFTPLEEPRFTPLEEEPESDYLSRFTPITSAGRGVVQSYKGMLNSFERGAEAWLEFTKKPVIKATIAALDPSGYAATEGLRMAGMEEHLAADVEARKRTMTPAPEGSIGSLSKDAILPTVSNYLSYQLSSLPAQTGPGMLAALAGGIVGGAPGANIAAFGTSYIQNMGELYDNLLEKGLSREDAAKYAQAGALPMAMLDTGVTGWLGGKLAKKLVAKQISERAAEEVAKRTLKQKAGTALIATGAEGVTEGIQEIIGSATEAAVVPGEKFLTDENYLRWADAAVAGALMGGVVGGAVEALPTPKKTKGLFDYKIEDEARQMKLQLEQAADPTLTEEQFDTKEQEAEADQLAEADALRREMLEEEARTREEEEAARTLEKREVVEPMAPTLETAAAVTEQVVTPSKEILTELAPTEPTPTTTESTPVALQLPFPSVHELINERNTEYHATDLEGMKGVLAVGLIAPNAFLHQGIAPGVEGVKQTLENQAKQYKGGYHLVSLYQEDVEGTPVKRQKTEQLNVSKDVTKAFAAAKKLAASRNEIIRVVDDIGRTVAESPTDDLAYEETDYRGVSTSRVPRVHTKASKAIMFVLDAEKLPARRPFAESGYEKTGSPELKRLGIEDTRMNPHFEFENRTYNEPIPLSAVKAILVDRSALQEEVRSKPQPEIIPESALQPIDLIPDEVWEKTKALNDEHKFEESAALLRAEEAKIKERLKKGPNQQEFIEQLINNRISEIQQLAFAKGIPVRVYESGKAIHSSRAQLQVELLNAKASEIAARIRARMAAKGPNFLKDETGDIDYEVFKDLIDYGMTRIAAGVKQFEAWSQEMIAQFGEAVRPILRDIFDAANARIKDPELAKIPPAPHTEEILRGLGNLISNDNQRQSFRADLDKFGWISKNFLNVLQWSWRNPWNVPLKHYVDLVREFAHYGDKWRALANDTITDGMKLSKPERKSLANMIYDMTLWSYKLSKAPTDAELDAKRIEVAKKHGVTQKGMEMYYRIMSDMKQALAEEEIHEVQRIERVYARAANQTPELLLEKQNAIKEAHERFARLREKEYFPLARFGKLALIVKAKQKIKWEGKTYQAGELVEFDLFEHEKTLPGTPSAWRPNLQDGKKAAQQKYPAEHFSVYDWQLPEDIGPVLAYPAALYKAIETGLKLNEDQQSDLRQMVIKSSPATAFIQHWNQRRGTAGFSRDMWRTYANYFSSFANHISRLKYRDQLDDALLAHKRTITPAGIETGSARKRQQIQDALQIHFNDLMSPRNYLPTARAYATLMYFLAVPKQAIINLTAMPIFVYPYVTDLLRSAGHLPVEADALAVKYITRALYDASRLYQGKTVGLLGFIGGAIVGAPLGPAGAGTGAVIGQALATKLAKKGSFETGAGKLTAEDIAILKRAHETGLVDQGQATMLASLGGGNSLIKMAPFEPMDRLFKAVLDGGMLPFRASEQYMRIATALAVARLSRDHGLSERAAFNAVNDAVEQTMFVHEHWARPRVMRNWGAAVTIFKTYLQNALYQFFQGRGRMRSWLMLGMLGGLMALPGAEDLTKLIDALRTFISKKFFADGDPHKDTEKDIRETFKQLDLDPDLMIHGLSRNSFGFPYLVREAGLPVPSMDFSASLSMGRLMPFVEPVAGAVTGTYNAKDFAYRSMQDALGVVGTMGNGMLRYGFDSSDRSNAFFRLVAPQFARYSSLAFEAQNEKAITNNMGQQLVKFDLNNLEQRNEIVSMPFGMLPTRVAKMQEGEWARSEAAKFYFSWRNEILNDYVNAFLQDEKTGGREKQEEVLQVLKRYNLNVPAGLQISANSVVGAVEARKKGQALDALGLPTRTEYIQLWKDYQAAYGETKP